MTFLSEIYGEKNLDRLCVLYGVDEGHILRNWSVETIQRKLVHGVEFDLLRRGFGSPKESEDSAPLTIDEADQLTKEYLPVWVSPHVK